jgi:putative DNA primase/helicase
MSGDDDDFAARVGAGAPGSGLDDDDEDEDFTGGGNRPEIEIRVGETPRAVDEAEAALIAAQAWSPVDKRVFRRGDRIVALAIDKGLDHKGRTVESQIIVELGAYGLAERLTTAAIFLKYDGRMKGGGGLKQIDVPEPVVLTLRERGYSLRLPVLVGVVNCPQFAVDGRIVDQPGYDAATGVFFDPRGAKFPVIAENLTKDAALIARDRLLLLFRTFDFNSEKDRAVAMSLVLTNLARMAMATAPLHAFDAPVAGSGKSMIVDIVSVLATGETAIVFAQGATPEEFEKRLAVQLMKGRQIVAIDNITQELDGDLLNQALTQEKVDLRPLGASRAITVRNLSVHTATGNNLRLVGDLTRRSVVSRLDPKTARPEVRQFDYDPLVDARENRGELVAAALTILRAYHLAGRPGRPPRLQGFAEWSDTVRGALMWVGLGDPATTQDRLRENDPKLATLIRVATVWRKAFSANPTTVAEAVTKAEERKRVVGAWDYKVEPVDPDLFEAFMAVARRGAAINPVWVGNYLSSSADRVVVLETGTAVRFEKTGTRHGVVLWALSDAPGEDWEVPYN